MKVTILNSTVTGNSLIVGGYGGAIYNNGCMLMIANSTFSDNSASPTGFGGGIYNDGGGTVTVTNSTLSGNSASFGGGIYNDGTTGAATLLIANSTLSGNSVTNGPGGAIVNDAFGFGSYALLVVTSSTLSGNSASATGFGGIVNYGAGTSIGELDICNTILNGDPSGSNIVNFGGFVNSFGFNLSSDNGGGFLTTTGDQIDTKPLVGPLQDNGGPTFTHALLAGSPAIDKGASCSGAATTDQRGFPRPIDDPAIANAPFGNGADIGAFEVQPATPCTTIVTTTADSGPGSLRGALEYASDGDTIDASGVGGFIILTSGELLVNKSVAIVGPGPANLLVEGNAASRVFHIGSNIVATISGLTITRGFDTNFSKFSGGGGGIYNDHATLTVSNCTLRGNSVYSRGGGILNRNGTLTIANSTLSGNSTASEGGAIANEGFGGGRATLTVSDCTLSGFFTGRPLDTSADIGGGIFNAGALGGSAMAMIVNSTLSGLSATYYGGGIANTGGDGGNATLTVSNCTLSDNSAIAGGGGIANEGSGGSETLTILNCTLSSNSTGLGPTAQGEGGGIYNNGYLGSAALTIGNSAISANSSTFIGGGIYNDHATLTVSNCTLSGNSATNGGGILNAGTLTLANSTLSGNSASVSGGIGNGFIFSDGGVLSGTLEIGSTILNAGVLGANIANPAGTVTSLGYNLSSDDGGGFLTATGDQINTDPLLGPLQDNGGPTFAHALLCGSPAIDKGRNFTGSATDQRGVGFARIFDDPAVSNAAGGDGTDIGAFEVQTACNRPPVAKCRSVTVSAGANCTANASIDNGSFDPEGNPVTLTQSPAGPYPLGTNIVTLTVTDSHGASNSGTALVIVRDTAPPQITCPTNITVEFTSTNGAVVSFAPTASDACSGPPVVVCVPASGSIFPIGTTPVLCTAKDLAGNSASCAFQVTVFGARGIKRDVLADLRALQGKPGRGGEDDRHALDLAARFLAASLEARFWVDETHVHPLSGGLAISEEALAVHELEELMCSRYSPATADILRGFIQRVVKCDRLLAVVSFEDAARSGAKPRKLQQAWLAVSKGDAEATARHYSEAIEHYGNAWESSQLSGMRDE